VVAAGPHALDDPPELVHVSPGADSEDVPSGSDREYVRAEPLVQVWPKIVPELVPTYGSQIGLSSADSSRTGPPSSSTEAFRYGSTWSRIGLSFVAVELGSQILPLVA
jgi:hypothetical protein